MSSTDLRSQFAEHGFARLTVGFPPEDAATMAEAIWVELARKHGICREHRSTWTVAEPRGLGALSRKGVFDALAAPAMTAAISELLGHENWSRPDSWGGPLVTFPGPGEWNVPTGAWHIDYPARGAAGATLTLKWLAYLVPIAAHGAGTVVLAGSHRLVEQFLRQTDPAQPGRSSTVRDAIFATHPWLQSIQQPGEPNDRATRLMTQGATVSGIPLRVVELTGNPGDVIFMHPHLFHAPAPNRSTTPRLMLTGGLTTPDTPPHPTTMNTNSCQPDR